MNGADQTGQARDTRPKPSDDDLVLKQYGGERPPAPDWFGPVVETPYRTGEVTVQGARIAYQAWGDPSKPGLLLAHGNGAHSHWWDFIAPFFADDYHVVAPSFSGMGDSDWRKAYSFSLFSQEQHAVCEHAGLFAHSKKPLMVAHSFGGIISLHTSMITGGDRFGGAVIVDSHIEPPGKERPRPPRRTGPNRIYPDFDTALSRFRLAPPQPCANHFLVDYIARHSLKPATDEDGHEGYTWKFDPYIFNSLMKAWDQLDLTSLETLCPIMFMRGADSMLATPSVSAYMSSLQNPPVPMVTVPDAHHHNMLDQPLAFVSAVRGILSAWPAR
jgi:pimeloyl-ACP methyl ester carboxylesterase